MEITPSTKKALLAMGGIIIIALIGYLAYLAYGSHQQEELSKKQEEQIEKLKLQNDQLQLANQYQQLNDQYVDLESQTRYIKNDTIVEKYNQAKERVAELLKELKSQKTTSAKRIKQLQDEIVTLKGIMRHYVAIIDSLGKENEGLKLENSQMRSQNEQLSSQVANVSQKNETLNRRMELAEKLNITGLTLTPLKGNGKNEKKVSKAKQLQVRFTIPQNNSTPVGEKTLYVRITGPEGSLLGQRGTFHFEGGNVAYTERKTIEYTGQEVPGITIYYNVNTTLNPGTYTVEVFADNYRLASRGFTLN